ncbi:MAG: cold shock domain-containing protein, partial [Candidatus Cloacimonas sp.]|nr:cold shock domain-containing protein [Candidatus Cloacimonas sp.]
YISEKGYGFIRLDANNSTAFFHYSNYQDNLGHLPIAGTRVIVSVRVDEKNGKLRIHKFFSPVEFDCGEAQFNDFGSPSTDELYVAYIDSDNQVKEISRANLEQLPLAVAYYKSTDRDKHHLLQAIETMIQHRFNDQKISPNKLIDDRFRLLNELVRESVENNLPFQLSEYQYRLQVLKYEPQKLTSCTNGEKGSFIMLSDVTVPEMNTQETGWEFINHDSEITEAETVKGWDIDHDDNSEGVGDVITHLKWDIDMRELGNILNFDRTQAYYNIEL